jgi:heat shock protein HtpX
MFRDLYNALATLFRRAFPYQGVGISAYEMAVIRQRTDKGFRLASAEQDSSLIENYQAICKKAGVKKPPRLIVYEAEYPAASHLHSGAIIVSSGLLERLTPEEQKFVLSHEIVHSMQKNTDTLSHLIGAVLPIFSGIAAAAYSQQKYARQHAPIRNTLQTIGVFAVTHEIIKGVSNLLLRSLGRALEYDADRGALIITNDLDAAKSEFAKYEQYLSEKYNNPSIPTPEKESTKPFTGWLQKLRQTHPSTHDRVSHLEKVKKQMDEGELKDVRPSRFW